MEVTPMQPKTYAQQMPGARHCLRPAALLLFSGESTRAVFPFLSSIKFHAQRLFLAEKSGVRLCCFGI
jgi:hypothetical protein